MQNDRKIIICAAGSRKATFWPAQEIYLSELWDKLRTPVRGTEAQADYLALKNATRTISRMLAASLRVRSPVAGERPTQSQAAT